MRSCRLQGANSFQDDIRQYQITLVWEQKWIYKYIMGMKGGKREYKIETDLKLT